MTAVIKSEYKYGKWYENYWKRIIYRRGFAGKNPVKICYTIFQCLQNVPETPIQTF